MTLYTHELLCVAANGHTSVTVLTVEDDDNGLTSQEVGPVYTLGDKVLASTPTVFVGSVSITLVDGKITNTVAMSFDHLGKSYYLFNANLPVDAIASFNSFAPHSEVGGIRYTTYGATIADAPTPYQAMALYQSFTDSGALLGTNTEIVSVLDDDAFIQFNGANGAANSETGASATGFFGNEGNENPFNDTDAGVGDTRMIFVRVDYTGPSGSGSFKAIQYEYDQGPDYAIAYIPKAGSVDLADVTTVDKVKILGTSLDGMSYADFGLTTDTTRSDGTNIADLLIGSWLNDKFKGLEGQDTLIGGYGQDVLDGGKGQDLCYGGQHADTLDGGGDDDTLYGRSYDDSLVGGNGFDVLYGGWGDDTLDGGDKADVVAGNDSNDLLTGGKGADTLRGAAGNDTLDGGGDADDLRGGAGDDQISDGGGTDFVYGNDGADTFIFGTDGTVDTLMDFTDGIDLIDLTTPYKNLVFIDFGPGHVNVEHAGETLVIRDLTGTLTSADLTRADFN
jgi:Ca2+-binding RTX toxin-like protein